MPELGGRAGVIRAPAGRRASAAWSPTPDLDQWFPLLVLSELMIDRSPNSFSSPIGRRNDPELLPFG